ncbi:enterochelin esterase domain-containing protein [Mariniluteicoccus flavus]
MSSLLPTPVGEGGAPLPCEPRWLRDLRAAGPDAVLAHWRRGDPTPVTGDRATIAGVAMVETTFLAEESDPATEVMVHLNGLTDAHRDDLDPAFLPPIPGTPVRALSVLLPTDGTYGYRLVHSDRLDRAAGRTRDGWTAIHRAGRPDPRNPDRLPHAHGEASSVWTGPHAVTTERWGTPDDGLADLGVTHADGSTRQAWASPGDLDRWLVVHDGQVWRQFGLGAALEARLGSRPGLVLVDSGDQARRAADLPHAARTVPITADVLAAVSRRHGPLDPARTTIAGQSFGGLAAALTVAARPDLAATAIVQSGSFWFDPARDALRAAGHLAGRRFMLQAGTDEARAGVRMADLAAAAAEDLGAAGAGVRMADLAAAAAEDLGAAGAGVRLDQWRGGHDYAWWRHGLVTAYAELLGR